MLFFHICISKRYPYSYEFNIYTKKSTNKTFKIKHLFIWLLTEELYHLQLHFLPCKLTRSSQI